MGNFMNAVADQLDHDYNVSITENGAVGYATTRKNLLDMNFKVASYRNRSEQEIIRDFCLALNEDFDLSVAWLFYARDAREGLGERRLFRTLIKYLANNYPEQAAALVDVIAEYGRWDDLLALFDTPVSGKVLNTIAKQVSEDQANMKANKPVSLLAKWLPSENASSKVSRAHAQKIASALHISPRTYRKTLSALRNHLNVVERLMSANKWEDISYEAVPSKANLLYRNAFLKHDEDRRNEYLAAVNAGQAKINSSVAFPHEIAHKYGSYGLSRVAVDPALEALWKALPDFGLEDTLCVADGSGSMFTCVDRKSSVQAIEVANALAVYTAEHCKGEFKNKYITFSSRPQLVTLGKGTLLSKLQVAYAHDEVSNTNIKATFDLILRTAVNAHMAQEDLPKNILIISDMEFDSATGWGCGPKVNETLFSRIQAEYAAAGYNVPKLIFWNVCSRTCTIPVLTNNLGITLVSGFSLNIMKMVMSNKLDPWEALVEAVTADRYKPIFNALEASRNNT